MALTKISRGLLNTGISDSSDATAITISSSEQVMIGTTDAGYADYGDSLTVADVDGGGGNAGMTIRSGTSSYGTFYFSDATGTAAGTYAGKIQYNHSTNSMVFGTNSSDKLTIDSSGNVGIGTTSPRGVLDLGSGSGDGTLDNTPANYQLILEAAQSTTGDIGRNIAFVNSTNNVSAAINSYDAGTGVSNGLVFATAASGTLSERMRIDSNGKVIINARSDGLNLQVKAEDDDSYFGVYDDTNNSANIEIRNSAGNQVFYVLGHNGNYYFAGSAQSDRDLKENIEAISESSLAKVKLLEPKTFNFKGDDNFDTNKKTGFIAQEVAAIFGTTEGVATGTDGQKDMGIDPTGLIAHLTKAIQEQQEQIEAMQLEIDNLKKS